MFFQKDMPPNIALQSHHEVPILKTLTWNTFNNHMVTPVMSQDRARNPTDMTGAASLRHLQGPLTTFQNLKAV